MLKSVKYGRGKARGTVVYFISGQRCIFSGISHDAPNTRVAAEQIVRAIAKAEKKSIHALRFYDLQTRCGYPEKRPGQFQAERLILSYGKTLEVTNWLPERISQPERAKFREYI